jgi:two-component sensor histidine kinase
LKLKLGELARKKEIHHRIKNNLQVISSLLDLQAEKFEGREYYRDSEILEAFRESQDRVASIALIHEELHEGRENDTLNFSQYLEKLAENLFKTYIFGNNIELKMNLAENVYFDMDIAVPLGIIVNELISNSLKHAFPECRKGKIQIILIKHEKKHEKAKKDFNGREKKVQVTKFTLEVSDNGIGIPEAFNVENSGSLGLQLISILVDQLDGKLELKRENGTRFIIQIGVKEN